MAICDEILQFQSVRCYIHLIMTVHEMNMVRKGVRLRLVGIVEDGERVRQKKVFGFELLNIDQVESLNPDGILITSIASQEERVQRAIQRTKDSPLNSSPPEAICLYGRTEGLLV